MDILILGGTRFVGRHITQACLDAGHSVTLFNRGQTDPDLFAGQVEQLTGDRDGGLTPLAGGTWDACIDVSGYVPRVVRASAELLSEAVERYVFISTISVYEMPVPVGIDESAPKQTIEDPTSEEVSEHYGALKMLCEEAVGEVYGEGGLIIRPSIVSGSHDPTDRVTYWVDRVARGGQVFLPAGPDWPFQTIDVRDLADAVLFGIDEGLHGAYNVAGPVSTWGEWVNTIQAISGSDPDLVWAHDDAFLMIHTDPQSDLMQGSERRSKVPMYAPERIAGAIWTVSSGKLHEAGFSYRPVEQTVRFIYEWVQSLPEDYDWQAGLLPEQEAGLIEAWPLE